MPCAITPISQDFPRTRPWAVRLGWKCSLSTAASTAVRFSAVTGALPLSTRETVATDTLATAATSRIVTGGLSAPIGRERHSPPKRAPVAARVSRAALVPEPPVPESPGAVQERRGPGERRVPVDRDLVRRVRRDVVHVALLRRAADQPRGGERILELRVRAAGDGARRGRREGGVRLVRPEVVGRVLE